ncbi:MAG: hypothetical protein LBK53_02530 [Heliobacteriaceae bacterium]|nr:hypothetical protein [Heliobacteriaceae bacterium]
MKVSLSKNPNTLFFKAALAAGQETAVQEDIPVYPKDEFVKKSRRQGFIERFYNALKNKTKIGLGSDKVENAIDGFNRGQIPQENLDKIISKYEISQENAAQTFGDAVSGLAGIGAYFGIQNAAKHLDARFKLKCVPQPIQDIKIADGFLKKLENVCASKSKVALIALPVIAIYSGIAKNVLLRLNNTGRYKPDKSEEMTREERKAVKKALKAERKAENRRNFFTGALNGLLAPVAGLAGGLAGAPAYIVLTTGARYMTSRKNEDKSFSDFASGLKDNAAVNILGAAATAVPAFKTAKFSTVLSKNMDSVVKKLKDVKFKKPDFYSDKTVYDELENLLLKSDAVDKILSSGKKTDAIIKALTEENIFAVKFKQIQGNYDPISTALKENCPASRTIAAAQTEINKLIAGYKVSKCLGVGTVAEAYLAKDASGKEVVIKILKKGISAEKILKDKEKFIALVKNGIADNKLSDEQKYLLKNIDNLSEGILKEVDFVKEMEAAKKLKAFTEAANVVEPISAKQGIYIMEKAPGISLNTLDKYCQLESKKAYCTKQLETVKDPLKSKYYKEALRQIEGQMKNLKAKSPDFEKVDLTDGDIKLLLKQYIDVFVEQFNKIEKGGKTLHANIHPGNIFIDINALQAKKDKIFTLIDIGNTIGMTKGQSLRALKLTNYIHNGNVKDITSYVMDGAVLPAGMTPKKAAEHIEKELRATFFNSEISLDKMNNESLLKLTNNIMKKYNIIPSDTQLNLSQAQKSTFNSFKVLIESFINKKTYGKDIPTGFSLTKDAAGMMVNLDIPTRISLVKDAAVMMVKYKNAVNMQEMKNLFKMSPKEFIKQRRNSNMNKTNSQDYLIYKLKQDMSLAAMLKG